MEKRFRILWTTLRWRLLRWRLTMCDQKESAKRPTDFWDCALASPKIVSLQFKKQSAKSLLQKSRNSPENRSDVLGRGKQSQNHSVFGTLRAPLRTLFGRWGVPGQQAPRDCFRTFSGNALCAHGVRGIASQAEGGFAKIPSFNSRDRDLLRSSCLTYNYMTY